MPGRFQCNSKHGLHRLQTCACGPLEKKHKLRIGSSDRWIRIVVPVQKHTECCGIQSTDTPGRSDNS